MADRVAIFNDGRIVQAGSPGEVYERPRSRFVADFVGSSNILSPEFSSRHGGPANWTSLRPEKITAERGGEPRDPGASSAEGRVVAVHYQGAITRVVIEFDGTRLIAAVPAGAGAFAEGDLLRFVWNRECLVAMEDAG